MTRKCEYCNKNTIHEKSKTGRCKSCFNKTKRGEKRKPLTEEHKKNISLGSKGKIISEEGRKNIALAKIGDKNPMWNNDCKFRNFWYLKNLVAAKVIDTCSVCGSNKYLCVHHKDENKSNDDINNFQIVCKSCHSKIHKANKNFRRNL